MKELEIWLQNLPEGYSERMFECQKYGTTKTSFSNGKSCKVYAKALGHNDFVSFNCYRLENEVLLKPCEMPQEKVVNFIKNSHKIEE